MDSKCLSFPSLEHVLNSIFSRWWFTVSEKTKMNFLWIDSFLLELVSVRRRRERTSKVGERFRGYTTADPPSFALLVRFDLNGIVEKLCYFKKQKAKIGADAIESVHGRAYTIGSSAQLLCSFIIITVSLVPLLHILSFRYCQRW